MNNRKSLVKLWTAGLLLSPLLWPASLEAGWVRKKGEAVLAADISYLSGDKYYAPSGKKIDITRFTELSASLYSEYGFTDAFTAGARLPFSTMSVASNQNSDGAANTFLGDMSLGGRYQFLRAAGLLFSGGLTIDLPTGDSSDENNLYTGDGEFNFLYTLAIAGNFKPVYWRLTAGFNQRTASFSDEVRWSLLAGIPVVKKLLAAEFEIQHLISLENSSDNPVVGSALFSNNAKFLAWRLGVVIRASERDGFRMNYKGAFSGQNIIAAPAISAGYYLKF